MNILIYVPFIKSNNNLFLSNRKWYDKEKSEPKKEIVAFSFFVYNFDKNEVIYEETEVSITTFDFRKKIYDLSVSNDVSYSIDIWKLDKEYKEQFKKLGYFFQTEVNK